ncbi:MAG: hypothetical protein AB9907_02950 [Flexilinea sp.]
MHISPDCFLPLELIFNPNWWNKTAGISFDKPFYFDAKTREANDVLMRRILFERFGTYGFGDKNPQSRPVIGSQFVAGGFIIPAMLGAEIRFSAAEAPQPLPKAFSKSEIESFTRPIMKDTWPMNELIKTWDEQEKEYGYLTGDLNTDGLLNAAYHFYGTDLFTDLLEEPDRPEKFMYEISELIVETASYIHSRTAGYSISVNRMASRLNPTPFIHANCSVQMISPRVYSRSQLPIEQKMAERIQPFGIHHCGVQMEKYAREYAKIPVDFCDVGWGSDPGKCREALPGAFLNLRLSPIRLLRCTPDEAASDTEYLLSSVGSLDNVGICCINMDYGTPDENIIAVCETVEKFRKVAG